MKLRRRRLLIWSRS